jgi:predicted nucleic acid-binding protein
MEERGSSVIVVDSNVLVYLLLPGVHRSVARGLFTSEGEWAAPILWRSELRNALAGYMRRGELLLEEALVLHSGAEDVIGENEYEMDSLSVLELVRGSDCTAYDCEYVALAKQLGVKLVTMDKQVLRAFPEVAVPLAE